MTQAINMMTVNFHKEQKENTMKQNILSMMIPVLIALMALLTGCNSLPFDASYSANVKIQELAKDAKKEDFATFGEVVHFAQDRIRRCKCLAANEPLTPQDRETLQKIHRHFEQMDLEGQYALALDAYQRHLFNDSDYQSVKTSLEVLCKVLGKLAKRKDLWSYKELTKIIAGKANCEADCRTLAKYYAESLKKQQQALAMLRQHFENHHAKKYYTEASAIYDRQKHKWFNWKWLGCWRDDVDALFIATDYCKRIIEGKYVSSHLHNSAAQLLSMTMGRLSSAERRLAAYRRNTATSFTAFKDYPADYTEQDAKSESLAKYREDKGVPTQKKDSEIISQVTR